MAQVIVALENIRSLFNIGAIFRTCEFFGVEEVFLVGYTGRERNDWDELHHKIGKTALGAEKNLKIKFFRDGAALVDYVSLKNLPLVAIEQHPKSISIENWQAQNNSVLVFGSETDGVSAEILAAASQIVEIPRLGKKNSLNVSICAGIVIAKIVASR
jgi:tRNA G18 (ribose-2'-O)-methylase SpoU